MSVRATILGLLLVLFICLFTYFNDHVIRQTYLIGNSLPVGVFGSLLILLMVLGPLLHLLPGTGPLRASEAAVITAMGLAVCFWPGGGFARAGASSLNMPNYFQRTETHWQATHIMSYLPGGSAELAAGFVHDWNALAGDLAEAAGARPGSAKHLLWHDLSERAHRIVRIAQRAGRLPQRDRLPLLRDLNQLIRDARFYRRVAAAHPSLSPPTRQALHRLMRREDATARQAEHLNRRIMEDLLPGAISPPPKGAGVLVGGGQPPSGVVDPYVHGWEGRGLLSVTRLPWSAWWPAIRFWGSFTVGFGLLLLCMAVIVHPQWSQREMLPYPIARFVDEVTYGSGESYLPSIFFSKMFRIGLLATLALHMVNGTHTWLETTPYIKMNFDFGALRELFPYASNVPMNTGVFAPTLYLSVVAFTFLLTSRVSLSLGISLYLWVFIETFMLRQGMSLNYAANKPELRPLLKFGSWLAAAGMIVYLGRRYYLRTLMAGLGFKRDPEVPPYAVWAMRLMPVLFGVCVALLSWYGGLDPGIGALFILIMMIGHLVLGRISAETGVFFIILGWSPFAIVWALLGDQAMSPTIMLVLYIAFLMLGVRSREGMMPFVINALRIGHHTGRTSPRRLGPVLAGVIIFGFIAAGATTLFIQYNVGVDFNDHWGSTSMPSFPFDFASTHASHLAARQELAQSEGATGLARWGLVQPMGGMMFWMGLGVVLFAACAAARLTLAWWPLHPVLFLFWGTHPSRTFAFSLLIGWAIKSSVVGVSGAKGYNRVKPLMMGIIAGEMLGIGLWIVVGTIYYFVTGLPPVSYVVMPP